MNVLFLPQACSEACTDVLWKTRAEQLMWSFIGLSQVKRSVCARRLWNLTVFILTKHDTDFETMSELLAIR